MEQPVKDPSEFKPGINYIKCSRCGWWYPEGHGCPDHNPWKRCQIKTNPLIIYYREANHGLETIKTRGTTIIAGYGHDYVIMVAEGEYYSVNKKLFGEKYTVLDE